MLFPETEKTTLFNFSNLKLEKRNTLNKCKIPIF